ncbi:hypothetical protein TNCV_1612401 [Trichonephila clavipes]|nr:hypothetical protein TNCV_1612401 [Trichonephila clavipes]
MLIADRQEQLDHTNNVPLVAEEIFMHTTLALYTVAMWQQINCEGKENSTPQNIRDIKLGGQCTSKASLRERKK